MSQPAYNEDIRARLEAYRTRDRKRPLTMTALGLELGGISATRVNKYLRLNQPGAIPEGNIPDIEARAADILKSASQRTISDIPPFDTNATQVICGTFELVRKTNDVGLISGPAGIGKSVSVRMYTKSHPTTIAVSVPRWQRSDAGMAALIFQACDARDWDGRTPRTVFMAERLRASNRLIILDNAQRMTPGAREWIFDFHDETGCPIALIGNPEVLQAIRLVDQHFSRIGIHQEVTLRPAHIKEYATKLVDALVAAPADGLYDLALAVAEQRGHLRALRKQILLMLDLCETRTYNGDQLRAFHAAHARLVRDYDL